LINSSLKKLRSLDATETGRVKNSDYSVTKSGQWRRKLWGKIGALGTCFLKFWKFYAFCSYCQLNCKI